MARQGPGAHHCLAPKCLPPREDLENPRVRDQGAPRCGHSGVPATLVDDDRRSECGERREPGVARQDRWGPEGSGRAQTARTTGADVSAANPKVAPWHME